VNSDEDLVTASSRPEALIQGLRPVRLLKLIAHTPLHVEPDNLPYVNMYDLVDITFNSNTLKFILHARAS
jgi:hypothetical protein